MAKVHRPQPGIGRAVQLGVENAKLRPVGSTAFHAIPYSYGTPCYWAYHGAYRATLGAPK